MISLKAKLLIGAVLVLTSRSLLFAVDSEPHLKTKLCNPAETFCTDVTSGNRAKTDADVTSSVLPTGASTSANQSTQINSLQILDDIPHIEGATISKGAPIMGQLDDTATTSATEDKASVARLTPKRGLHINLRDNSGVEIGSDSNPINVSGNLSSSDELLNGRLFSVASEINAAASYSDNPMILFKNPASSGKIIYIHRVTGGITFTNVSSTFKIFFAPTITANGTTLTGYSTKRVSSPATHSALLYTLPTISANGSVAFAAGQGENTDLQTIIDGAFISLAENTSLLVTAAPSTNNRTAIISIMWSEVPI